MAHFDVVVCGLGAMGSAALHQLAAGASACWGSSASRPATTAAPPMARTRIIRLGYFEHPSYVPLLRRAYALWRELEAAAGRTAAPCHRHRRDRPARGRAGAGNARLLPPPRLAPRGARGGGADAPLPGLQAAGGLRRRGSARRRVRRGRGVDRGTHRAGDGGGSGNPQRRARAGDRAARGFCAHRHRSRSCRGRRGDRRRRRLDQVAASGTCRAVAGDARGHGLVRADRGRAVFGVSGLHHREPARHALRRPAAMAMRRHQDRQASSPRSKRSTPTITIERFRRTTRP